MNAIVAWFKSKNISSHTIAAALVSVATLIVTDEQVRSFLVQALISHPKIAAEVIAVAGIIFKYSRGSSPAGAVSNVVADVTAQPPKGTQ